MMSGSKDEAGLVEWVRGRCRQWQGLLMQCYDLTHERNARDWQDMLHEPGRMDAARLRDLRLYFRHLWGELSGKVTRDNKSHVLWLLTRLHGEASAIALELRMRREGLG